MGKSLLILGIVSVLFVIPFINAQEFEKATLQETATVIYDQKLSNSIIASIGLETTNNEEIQFSNELIQKINSNEKIRSIVLTNHGNCVIGVTEEEQCLMVNFGYQELKGDGGIRTVQDSAKEMSAEIVEEMNHTLGMDFKFHSTFIHTVDDANILLETSGVVSGRGSVSATYVMPKQSTDFLFLDLVGKLIQKEIRDGGGFYDIAKKISKIDSSLISVSIIRNEESNLYMFKVVNEIKDSSTNISKINVLESLNVEEISRSEVFNGRNVPLNSIIQLIVIPNEKSKINAVSTHLITDLTKFENILEKGWFFSVPAGDKIDAKFLFGTSNKIISKELQLEIGSWDGQSELSIYTVESLPETKSDTKENVIDNEDDGTQYVVLGIIIIVGIGAAVFYLKGYKPKH